VNCYKDIVKWNVFVLKGLSVGFYRDKNQSMYNCLIIFSLLPPFYSHFSVESGLAVPSHFLPEREPLLLSVTGFYEPDILPVTESTV